MITETLISELITCPKKALKADRKRMVPVNRSLRNKVVLQSADNNYTFDLFLRQSEEFMADFSVGLIWTNAAKHIGVNNNILLIRFQGPHDSGKPLGEDLHHDYHVHQISVDDINEHRYFRPSNKGPSKDFYSLASALFSFIDHCAIINLENCIDLSQFNTHNQIGFFDNQEEGEYHA